MKGASFQTPPTKQAFGGRWRGRSKGLLNGWGVGDSLGPGKGWGHPDKSARPPLPLPPHGPFKPASRRGGAGSPPFLLPPSNPGSSASQRPSRPGYARARTLHTSGAPDLTLTHTHTHTHTPANKGSGHPGPLRPQAGEGGASPPEPPCKVSFGLRLRPGGGTWPPGRERLRAGKGEFHRSPKKGRAPT